MRIIIKKLSSLLFLVILVLLFSCKSSELTELERLSGEDTSRLKETLQMAGKNRTELQNVLNHYAKEKGDSLKLRAAIFLIENMVDKYAEYYDAPWNDVATMYLRKTSSSDIQRVMNAYKLTEKSVKKNDVIHITADFLINNIELAFKVWEETPWGKDIPFDIFCEQILPYRLGTEPLENWREKALASFADVYSSFIESDTLTMIEACNKLNALLPRFRLDNDFPDMNFTQLMTSSRGPCDAMTALAIFSMRALGIPVVRDFTPKWPNMEIGHTWNAVYDGKGNYVSFMGTESGTNQPHQGTQITKYKIFRNTFGKQVNIDAKQADTPPSLQNEYMKDVSSEYDNCTDIVVPMLFQPSKPTDYAYLAVRIQDEWTPIAWGQREGTHIVFSSVGKKMLYLPVYYANYKQTPTHYPFLVEEDGNCRFLTADSIQTELILTGIDKDVKNFLRLMHYGRFEGANHSDFSDARILYCINEISGGFYHSANINTSSSYRYVRYSSPENGRCNVAEVEFYNKNGDKLEGTVIGMEGSKDKFARENAFDGDVTTAVNIENSTTAWVGLDLGTPTEIGKIRFLPRTTGNNIYEGHEYRLMYWDGHQWTSLGEQIATTHQLHYLAPANALFYLENMTRKIIGRYFTMKDGEQKWL